MLQRTGDLKLLKEWGIDQEGRSYILFEHCGYMSEWNIFCLKLTKETLPQESKQGVVKFAGGAYLQWYNENI